MRTTVTLDDELIAQAQELTGRSEVSAVVRMGLETSLWTRDARLQDAASSLGVLWRE